MVKLFGKDMDGPFQKIHFFVSGGHRFRRNRQCLQPSLGRTTLWGEHNRRGKVYSVFQIFEDPIGPKYIWGWLGFSPNPFWQKITKIGCCEMWKNCLSNVLITGESNFDERNAQLIKGSFLKK